MTRGISRVINLKNNLNKIFNGDCIELLKSLPDESVDLVVSSPPYNIGKSYEKKTPLSFVSKNKSVKYPQIEKKQKYTMSNTILMNLKRELQMRLRSPPIKGFQKNKCICLTRNFEE